MKPKSGVRWALAVIAGGVALVGAVAAAQQQAKPVELFNRDACVAPLQNKFTGWCIVHGVTGADGRFSEPWTQCNDDVFAAAAKACLVNGFRLDPTVQTAGPIEACLRLSFTVASENMPGRVGMAELTNCPPQGAKIGFPPPRPPMRVMFDFKNPHADGCTVSPKDKMMSQGSDCLVAGELTAEGRIRAKTADCDNHMFDNKARSCVQAYKLPDPFKGATGPICLTMTFKAGVTVATEYECGTPPPPPPKN